MISVTKPDVSVTVETFGPTGRHLDFFETDSHSGKRMQTQTIPKPKNLYTTCYRNPVLAYTRRVIFIHAICLPHYKTGLAVADSAKWGFCAFYTFFEFPSGARKHGHHTFRYGLDLNLTK